MPGYWCWLHSQPRAHCGAGGECPAIQRLAAQYREETAARKTVRFNVRRLRRQNEAGLTSREIAHDIVDRAKAEGRDLARPADYATQHWRSNQ